MENSSKLQLELLVQSYHIENHKNMGQVFIQKIMLKNYKLNEF